MPNQWYVVRAGKEQGPFTVQQLKSIALNGTLRREELIRRDDMQSAILAHKVKGLFPDTQPTLKSSGANSMTPTVSGYR